MELKANIGPRKKIICYIEQNTGGSFNGKIIDIGNFTWW